MCLFGHGSKNIPYIILSVREFFSSAVIHSSHNKLSLTGHYSTVFEPCLIRNKTGAEISDKIRRNMHFKD